MVRYYNSLKTVKEHFEGIPIQNINKRMYQSFLNEYGKTHAKASTRKLNTHIRACVKYAIDERVIRVDFTRGAVLTGRPGKKAEDKYLRYEESQKLLKAIHALENKSLIHYLILLGLTLGMRYAEMMGLKRDDFNFNKSTINVNKTWGYLKKIHF